MAEYWKEATFQAERENEVENVQCAVIVALS